ncbi:hypothetical protein AKO1_014604 [Acrasis kona]|uniref:Ribosome biogenesis protein NOP53 n=1 Tax=Acrasis kona TaxID=1008807 RepID=A0AAW2Z3T3_9EUKA
MKQPSLKRRRLTQEDETKASYEVAKVESEQEDAVEEVEQSDTTQSKHLSRQQRKRRKNADRATKRSELVKKIENANKKENNNTTSYPISDEFNLDDMHNLIKQQQSEIEKKQQQEKNSNKKLTSKKKQKQLAAELLQFENVIKHPAFVSDPIKTVQTHLANKMALIKGTERPVVTNNTVKEKRRPKLIRRDVSGLKNEKITGNKRKR